MLLLAYILLGAFCIGIALFTVYLAYAAWSAAPFVPLRERHVNRMLDLAGLKSGETLMDLGSGDGRILCAAAARRARAIGIEINPALIWWSRLVSRRGGHGDITIRRENLWRADVSGADVLTLFFIRGKMPALEAKLGREMKPGARVVSYGFTFPNWPIQARDGKIYLYVVHPSRGYSPPQNRGDAAQKTDPGGDRG